MKTYGGWYIQISTEPGSNWGPFGRKAEILPTAPTTPAQYLSYGIEQFMKNIVKLLQTKIVVHDSCITFKAL